MGMGVWDAAVRAGASNVRSVQTERGGRRAGPGALKGLTGEAGGLGRGNRLALQA